MLSVLGQTLSSEYEMLLIGKTCRFWLIFVKVPKLSDYVCPFSHKLARENKKCHRVPNEKFSLLNNLCFTPQAHAQLRSKTIFTLRN